MGLLEQVTLSGTDSKDKNISKYFYNNAGLQIKMYTGMSSENDTSYLTTNYEYDSWLRAVRTTDSTGYNSGTITYDLNGNVLTNTDANDNITTNTYDALNHVLTSKTVNSKDYKKNVSKSYEYDNMGRILRAVTNDLTTYYAYDDLGRKIEEIEGKNGYSTFKGFFYEGVSQYAREELIGQYNLLLYSSKTYEYDGEMRVVKVKESGNETASYTYDANGNKKSETLANGVTSTYTYNNNNKVTGITNKKGNSTISSYEYSYYLDGSDACKKTTENGIIETTEYEYDGLKRLTNEEVKKGNTTDTYSYEYDDYGNRSKMTATGTETYETVYDYSVNGKYTALLQKEVKSVEKESNPLDLNSNVKQTVYTYDANGNQIKKTAEGKTETNTYNGLNQLIGFTDGETTASYKYNASGLRYEKTVNGETINHVWDGNKQIVADVIDNQFYEADCYIRGTNLVAKYNYWNGDKSEYTYYTQNAHGDVVNLTDKDGKVTKSYKYDAFGVEKNIYENDTNAFRYCGEYYDKETATVYLRARNYNPSTGRFISRDTFAGRRSDPLSLNLYTYCRNNPIRYIDPSGHSYATLPDGRRMSMNSAADVKRFNELKSGKSQSSQVKTTTAPPSERTPITGGLSTQTTTTTVSTTVLTPEMREALQKKDTNIFTKISNGLNWFDNHVTMPVINGAAKIGKAFYHSTSFEFGAGCGFGAEVNSGFVSGSLLVVPAREEYVIASDCKQNVTGNYSIGLTFFDSLGLGAEAKRTAYNNFTDKNPYTAPGGHWENDISIISSNSSLSSENDFNIEIGGALYFFVGADFTLSFSISNFAKELGII